ncbi:NAD(P)H-dependent oxidoreductase subunit E [Aporhodopirellula aestuarii]|uniref:NAD(P)H-dependent oxidoreductase subunit E n=1 Tax=Aporhodopirellula aestuarii TaxID=2950107 RepID=A0ABT0U6X7_9BACT|nr:NAD(P)H-dependent oxidoreductase subunit E [Aporhodopirellula aestuarii]MCM2372717.1 NAD(P)H-dependent oxidoreductase subunit E [Aporhodopirellula aestuarii]
MNAAVGSAEKVVNDTTVIASPAIDLAFVDQTVAVHGGGPEAVIPILQAIQTKYRYLPDAALQRVCELTEITPSAITGVSTFYTQFRHRPMGRHAIQVCRGTACHVKGADLIEEAIALHLGLKPGEDTDQQGQFTIEPVACLGCCTLAPVVQIDDATYGRLTPQSVPSTIRGFARRGSEVKSTRRDLRKRDFSTSGSAVGEIRVGLGSCCVAQGSGQVFDKVQEVVTSIGAAAEVKRVGCVGMCHQTPLVETIRGDGTSRLYCHVQPEQVEEIVLQNYQPTGIVSRMRTSWSKMVAELYGRENGAESSVEAVSPKEGPVCEFLGPQKRIATESCGDIDPLDLSEYQRHEGFVALKRCLDELSSDEVISEIERSGLRGRGGAGFPSAIKWRTVRGANAETKYVICNGDEGDPGAFMDRMILESFPYRVIEGMAIAAVAVGAHQGYFYIRAEYPLAVERIRHAIAECEAAGLLGDRILGSDYSLKFSVKEGAGAFICGEETALIHSIEGGRGTPRLRPPFPAESGLWEKPTLINNVETLSLVPWILRHGGDEFAKFGTETSKGTKVFALAGKIQRGGLIEVPMGVTIRQIVNQIGGGVANGRRFKAVQIGGPSGGCVPASLADTPVDYEALSSVGAIMGSGGMVVLDDTDCMVDIARYFLRFTQDQSCGKCTYCRIGTKRMLEILERICGGEAKKGDLDLLEDLCQSVSSGSLCGLGKTAPNPVLSTLRYFREEYEAHLAGHCPAGKCKNLIAYHITDACIGCTLCAQHCPVDAIPAVPYAKHVVDVDLCTACDTCRVVCPENAVEIVRRTNA